MYMIASTLVYAMIWLLCRYHCLQLQGAHLTLNTVRSRQLDCIKGTRRFQSYCRDMSVSLYQPITSAATEELLNLLQPIRINAQQGAGSLPVRITMVSIWSIVYMEHEHSSGSAQNVHPRVRTINNRRVCMHPLAAVMDIAGCILAETRTECGPKRKQSQQHGKRHYGYGSRRGYLCQYVVA
ncbi:hypothetical protein BD289DRAFT_263591 [Coniella lustricola]|uniref:Uncharacterized protein n=1 Tax=Coniella lustricola TaxID=2025994 RepID=A0A2T3A7I5_9PEZI|nr:hypothetical protein BD289DRAFT_263591 [Coniella lustricola]